MNTRILNCLLLLVFTYHDTSFAQNVARTEKRVLNWQLSNSEYPVLINFSIGAGVFSGKTLPAITESFVTDNRSSIEITETVYTELNGFKTYKDNKLRKLKGNPGSATYHTLQGNTIYSAYSICPFKEENGRFYILKSYTVQIKNGAPFKGVQSASSNAKRTLNTSVLSQHSWYKFSVTADGVYKIDAAMLRTAGINPDVTDPRKIKIYSHQGAMLPEKISDFRHEDLPENSIYVFGENDGKFDEGDYILFYAQSPHKWNFDYSSGRFNHKTNIYSDKTFFFLTAEGANGKRIGTGSDGSTLTANAAYDWFSYLELHEDEKENICREGRIYLGEKFDQNLSYTFNHQIKDMSSDKPLTVAYGVAAVTPFPVTSDFNLRINGNAAGTVNLPYLWNEDDCYTYSGNRIATANVSGSIQLNFTYTKPVSGAKGWLDYYELQCSRKLKFSEAFMPFRNADSRLETVAEYRLSDLPANAFVYDVSDPLNPIIQPVFNDNGTAVFRAASNGKVKQYVLCDGSNFPVPGFEGTVANQNLHGLGIYQFIIVTDPAFLDAANKLANWHKVRDNMDVLVVTPAQIYNEFSSGSQDISAIRDFFAFMYYKNTNPVNQLKYAMFLGDASFDYKNKLNNNTNFIPVYESDPKLSIPYDYNYYCSDDFFGFLDSTDGSWDFEQKLEIAVTRMPVATASEAMSIVDKIIHYKEAASMGDWRTAITLCADDADADWEKMFVNDFEPMSVYIDTVFPNVNVRKIYLDAFKQQSLGGSQRYPDAQEAIRQEFEKGTLIFNYIGHGGEEYLATEKVIDVPLITSMKNYDNLPVFFTATCEFSRYDDVLRKSAGEYLITQSGGGAIAMFTTVRVVFAEDNRALTEYFWENCAYAKSGGKWPTLGQVYMRLKNRDSQSGNDRSFTLFADPALTMNYPDNIIKIDSVIHANQTYLSDTLKALDRITFKGHVEDLGGLKLSTFNGLIVPVVYDKQSTFKTMGNDLSNLTLPFKLYNNILYKGENSVTNGDFSFTFVVPKDISYNYGFGKLSLYADNGSTDAWGHDKDIIIGGTATNVAADLKGPEIELYIDDYSFVSGGLTDNSPLLLARVSDENGINTSGIGIGRDIIAIIDKGTANEKRFVLNTFYTAKLNSFTTGDIRYQLEGLEDGKHTYTLKVWDVYNNSSEATIDFVIRNNEDFTITHVLNYPNPFSDQTCFHFDHNRAGENLRVIITIMTITGKVMKTIDQYVMNAESHVGEICWNGRDDFEDKPSRGVYIYRITVSTDDGKKAEKVEKLVILN